MWSRRCGGYGRLGAAAAVDAVGKAVTPPSASRPPFRRDGGFERTARRNQQPTGGGYHPARDHPACSFCYTPSDFAEAASWLAQGKVNLDAWIVEAPLEDGGAWFERLSAETRAGSPRCC